MKHGKPDGEFGQEIGFDVTLRRFLFEAVKEIKNELFVVQFIAGRSIMA